jgi:PAS domain S-box-containing protein
MERGSERVEDGVSRFAGRTQRQISVGERFVLFRVERNDGSSVVLKALRADRRDARNEELLRHEWEVLARLDFDGVVRPLELEEGSGGPILVLDDAGPCDLSTLLHGRPLDTPRFLELAIAMADTVGELHRRGIIHRDICPMNFVVAERPVLVDFETATSTPAFTETPSAPSELAGTVAYIAPEQTGRMNRGVDHRADLYALGATFYEMLTGAPPFASRDPLDVLRAHIARRPSTPAVVNANVPTVLSDIVVKLLSKMPEWRYQTANALKIDLEEARRQWRLTGRIQQFELGRHDVPYGLLLGGNLYGRENAEKELERAIDRVASGRAEVVLVSGPAGIGKSALVHQVRDRAQARCRWLEGKGDQLHGNVPYAPVLEAFRGLIRETSRKPPDQVEPFRNLVRSAIAPNGRVLTEILPELEELIGEQPSVSDVGPIEAENRFQHVFICFVRALADERMPLVLFLDDLQWADPASIKLITAIATEPELSAALILGAYRTEEIGPDHAVRQATTRIRVAGTPVATIELGSLEQSSIVALLCEALRLEPRAAGPLAETIGKKTAGNPFFIRQFLGYLYRAGLLRYDTDTGRWSWDIALIERSAVTENVVDLLSRNIGMLPVPEQEALETAACIGNEFGLGLLAGVRGEKLDEVARLLRAPVQEGLLVPTVGGPRFSWAGKKPVELGTANAPAYRFVHDRVQEAAYRLLGDAAQKELHLRIGRWLLANAPDAAFEDAICSIVDQLDRAADRLTEDERTNLAGLNHRAGRLARAATAYTSALGYFLAALGLLPAEPWSTRWHELWFALVRDAAECAALTGDHAACERLIEEAWERADAPLEKAVFCHVLAQSNALRGAHEDAIRHGRQGLRLLGIDLPRDVTDVVVGVERKRTRDELRGRSDEQLLGAGPMEDVDDRVQLRLLVSLAAATWFRAPKLYKIVCFRAVDLTAGRGIAPDSPLAFAAYAIALAMDGEYEEAYRFGRLAVRLAERAGNAVQECRALMILGGHVSPWRAPLRDSIPLLRRAHRRGIESGELEYAAYAIANLLFALWFRGAKLDVAIEEADAALAFYRRIGHQGGIDYVVPFTHAARCLKGLTRDGASFDDDEFDEARFLLEAADNGLGQAVYHLLRLETCYILDEPALALEYARKGEPWLQYMRTIFLQADHFFYSALALSSLYDEASPTEKDSLHSALSLHGSRLETWARESPATFAHKHDLITAEIARVEGRSDVTPLYERAIARAGREGCAHEEALAHERCARFLKARGDEAAFEVHLRAAMEGYAEWGASAKVARLAAELPPSGPVVRPALSEAARALPTLDLKILLQAAETLSSELVLDRLLQKLMQICVEAASAERAALVLEENGLVLRALATIDGEVTLERPAALVESAFVPASILAHVLRVGEVVVLKDAARDPRFATDPYVVRVGVRSVLAVPLREQHRTVGILYFENNLATDAFTPDRVEVFRLLSAQMAIAIENSLLFEERRRAEESLRLLADASAALSESLDYDQVLATVGELVVPTLADWCILDVLEGDGLRPAGERHADPSKLMLVQKLHRAFPMDVDSPEPQARVLSSREPLLVSEVTEDFMRAGARNEEHMHLVQALEPRSLMVLPLVARGRGIGVLTLVRSHADRRYGTAELSLAEDLARRAALAVDNARLHGDLQESIRLRSDRDRYLRTIFRQVPGAIWATNRDLRFTYVAGNLRNAPRLDPKKLVGTTVYALIGTRNPSEPAIAHHLAALAGEPQSFQYEYEGRWYEALIEPLRDHEQQIVGCVGATFDVTERRATEERLARDEARLSEAQRIAHIGSFDWDIVPNVLSWSEELHRIYGIEPGQFAGTFEDFLARVHPDDLELTKNVFLSAFRRPKAFVYDNRIIRPDHSVRVLQTRGDVIKDHRGNAVRMVGSCWDVTELAEATGARERSLSLLQATLEATADGILVVARTGEVELVNQRLLSLWRLSSHRGELTDEETILDLMLQQVEDPDGFRAGVLYLQARPEAESADVVRLRDGRVFERHSRPERVGEAVVGRVWSYRDISDRERLLRRALFLSDATRLLGSLDADRALDAVAHLAVPYLGDGCAVDLFGNGTPRRLVAVSRDPKHPIVPEVHPSVLAGHATIYRVDSSSYLGVPLVTKGGIVGAMTLSASPGGKYAQADLDLAEELGRRAALGIENSRLYRHAEEALHARDEFLSIAAHEIRGPITSLHLAVQMLRRGMLPRDAQPRTFDIIEREDRRLARFVDELLDLSRIRAGTLSFDFEEVDLGQIVRNAASQLGSELARAGSSLSISVQGDVRGEWDRFRLDQIGTNLLSNAIKFGMGKPISIAVSTRDGLARLVVKDQGMGIAREIQDRVWKPFERAVSVRHYGGLGLGLYIVKTIAEAMGGRVGVESTLGMGSTFTVELPKVRMR